MEIIHHPAIKVFEQQVSQISGLGSYGGAPPADREDGGHDWITTDVGGYSINWILLIPVDMTFIFAIFKEYVLMKAIYRVTCSILLLQSATLMAADEGKSQSPMIVHQSQKIHGIMRLSKEQFDTLIHNMSEIAKSAEHESTPILLGQLVPGLDALMRKRSSKSSSNSKKNKKKVIK